MLKKRIKDKLTDSPGRPLGPTSPSSPWNITNDILIHLYTWIEYEMGCEHIKQGIVLFLHLLPEVQEALEDPTRPTTTVKTQLLICIGNIKCLTILSRNKMILLVHLRNERLPCGPFHQANQRDRQTLCHPVKHRDCVGFDFKSTININVDINEWTKVS